MKIAIIGYGPAAVRALEAIEYCAALSSAQGPEVTVISPEQEDPYAPMFLIKYATGQLTERQLRLVPGDREYSFPLERVLGKRAVQVMEKDKSVVLEDGQEIGYDRLLIASGASPVIPPIEGLDKKGVHTLRSLEDAKRVTGALNQVSGVVVIGAGALGMEAGIAFHNLGKRVKVVEFFGQILPQTLSPPMAEYVKEKLEARGIQFCLGEAVSEIIGKESAEGVVTQGGKEIKGDLILITAGVQPNMDFVKTSGIRTAAGIIVDDRMETNIPDIYAAGDVAESRNSFDEYELVFNWYSAVSQGWVAGCNIMGLEKSHLFSPMLSALKEIDFPVISIGRRGSDGYECLSRKDEKREILEEIYIRDNTIGCYQAIGIRDKAGLIYSFIMNRRKVNKVKTGLLTDHFNATRLIS
jgi:NAD(P)H-nitrite reductase large subunit